MLIFVSALYVEKAPWSTLDVPMRHKYIFTKYFRILDYPRVVCEACPKIINLYHYLSKHTIFYLKINYFGISK